MRERGEWDRLGAAASEAGAEGVLRAMDAMESASEVSEDAYAIAVRQLTMAIREATGAKVLDAQRERHATRGGKLSELAAMVASKPELAKLISVEVFVAQAQLAGTCMHVRSDPYHSSKWCISDAGHPGAHFYEECVTCVLATRMLEAVRQRT